MVREVKSSKLEIRLMYSSFSFRTLVRFAIIFVVTVLLASIIPGFPREEVLTYLTPIPVATIFAIVIAFYINDAITRAKAIETNVDVELSRVRRVFHLSKGFMSKELVSWASDLREKDINYIKSFGGIDFGEYNKSNEPFRELSYHIYQLEPKLLKTPKEIALYEELLETTREWALVRQNLQGLQNQKISFYSWVILLSISAILIFSLMLLRSQNLFSTKLVSGLSIIAVLFTLDLLHDIDYLSKNKKRTIARKYIFNLDKLNIDMPVERNKKRK